MKIMQIADVSPIVSLEAEVPMLASIQVHWEKKYIDPLKFQRELK